MSTYHFEGITMSDRALKKSQERNTKAKAKFVSAIDRLADLTPDPAKTRAWAKKHGIKGTTTVVPAETKPDVVEHEWVSSGVGRKTAKGVLSWPRATVRTEPVRAGLKEATRQLNQTLEATTPGPWVPLYGDLRVRFAPSGFIEIGDITGESFVFFYANAIEECLTLLEAEEAKREAARKKRTGRKAYYQRPTKVVWHRIGGDLAATYVGKGRLVIGDTGYTPCLWVGRAFFLHLLAALTAYVRGQERAEKAAALASKKTPRVNLSRPTSTSLRKLLEAKQADDEAASMRKGRVAR